MPFHTSVRILVILRGALLTAVVILIAVLVHRSRAAGGPGLSTGAVATIDLALIGLFVLGFASSIVLAEATLARANARIRRLRERATLAAHGIALSDPDTTKDALGKFDHALCEIGGEVRAANERLNSALELKSQFVATVSHELRTPLNGIIGMGEILLRSDLDSDQREVAQHLQDSSTALLAIINDILDFSKLEAGRVDLESIEFMPNALVNSVVDLVNRAAAQKPITLMTCFAADLPTKLRGDEGRLRQILLNLVGNAVKFTDGGHVLVSVDVAGKLGSLELIRWRVSDSGIGMPPEAQAHIFEPFAQGDASTTRRFGGTGLGLAICKRFVELMHGSMEIDSSPGQGTTVTFTIPLSVVEGATEPVQSKSLQGVRALVVSDEPIVRETIVRYISAWGLRGVAIAEEHRQVLERLRTAIAIGEPFGLIIAECSSLGPRCPLCTALKTENALAKTPLAILNAYGDGCGGRIVTSRRRPLLQSEVLDCIVNALTEKAAKPTSEHRVSAMRSGPILTNQIRVLIAEDNAINQRVAQRQLQILGAASHAVANGAEAIAAFESEPFDVVLMDCNMPVMDGFAAAREIRSRESSRSARVPIVAMTANASSRDREDCLAAGMDDYIAKPVMIEPLRAVLERVFRADIRAVGGA